MFGFKKIKIHQYRPVKPDVIEFRATDKKNYGKQQLALLHKERKQVIYECRYCGAWFPIKPGNPGILRKLNKEDAMCLSSPVNQIGLFGKYNCLERIEN